MSKNNGFWEMNELRLVVGALAILGGATVLLVVAPHFLLEDVKAEAAV